MFDDLVDDYMETGGSGVDVLARWNESKAQHDSDLAFVRQWRMKLEHRQAHYCLHRWMECMCPGWVLRWRRQPGGCSVVLCRFLCVVLGCIC
jgi:hypothetical protein